LANKIGEKGPTHVSAVRSESVLAGKVHVGDRFVTIDGEDVSGMNSREITSVMARKADSWRLIVFVPVQMSNRVDDWI
jgi:C-terminal processing protease CtpA/Prc